MIDFIWKNYKFALIYIAAVSLISVIVTVYDKIAAKRGASRTPEKTLLLLSALGGSVFMFLTMLMIRHKTQHLKFILGIPFIIIFQVIAVCFLASRGLVV